MYDPDFYIESKTCNDCGTCVDICPSRILTKNEKGKVLFIRNNTDLCIGCGQCVDDCPFTPARPVVNIKSNTATVCDLCLTAAYWSEPSGPNGKQACIESCPMRAIAFSTALPVQTGHDGYNVNLRTVGWQKLGYSIE